ncbi:MAG: phosphatase PAP2 family protein [Planctomycetaceae bacterium]
MPGLERALPDVRPLRKSRRRYRELLRRTFAVALLALPAAFFFDAEATIRVKAAPEGVLRALVYIGEWGDWPFQMGYGALLLAVALAGRRLRMQRVVICMLLASCVAAVVCHGMKCLTGRTRPSFQEAPQGFYGPWRDGELTLKSQGFASFPSGHASSSAGFLAVLFFARGRWPLLAALLIPLVPLARLSTRSHHLSDVTAGVLIGLLSAGLVWYHIYPRLRAGIVGFLRFRARHSG